MAARTVAGVGLLLWVVLTGSAAAQEEREADGGAGDVAVPRSNCLTDTQRAAIRAQLSQNVERLTNEGTFDNSALSVKLVWPMVPAPGLNVPATHGISNFVDQEPAIPSVRDYNCGTRTYDIPGYNHGGVDIYTWPFAWYRMDNSLAIITAAAAGTIIGKDNGNFDRNCAMGSGNWNAVYVRHDDGAVAWYGHMKNGSPTSKAVGQRVAAGEYLGVVGSSGSSTGPHLHLELYDPAGNLTEAYGGTCNRFAGTTSSWVSQRPYYDSAINEIATHFAPPVFPSCPTAETPNYRDVFPTGGTIYFVAYYRDHLAGQQTTYTIFRPNGTVWNSWVGTRPAGDPYSSAYWYWSYVLPATPAGTWKFRAQFGTQIVDHDFIVGSQTLSITDATQAEGHSGTSLLAFGLSLAYPAISTTTVNYATANGTALAPSDYTASSGTVTFAPGQKDRTLLVPVVGDVAVEPNEGFVVNLTSPVGATLPDTQASATIVDDDPPGAAASAPMWRLYYPVTNEHLYTTDFGEYTYLGTVGWNQEGIAYRMFSNTGVSGGVTTVPFYRLYSTTTVQHHWTTDPVEAAVLTGTPGWLYEGIVGYLLPSAASGTTPLYRLRLDNPPLHLWTTSLFEYTVISPPWVQEGIVGHVVP